MVQPPRLRQSRDPLLVAAAEAVALCGRLFDRLSKQTVFDPATHPLLRASSLVGAAVMQGHLAAATRPTTPLCYGPSPSLRCAASAEVKTTIAGFIAHMHLSSVAHRLAPARVQAAHVRPGAWGAQMRLANPGPGFHMH